MVRPKSRKDMDKLEKHIKTQIQNREISPSPKAWEKIAGELTSEKSISPKSTYWWAVAAGMVGLMVLSIRFFGSSDSTGVPIEAIVVEEGNGEGKILEILEEDHSHISTEKTREDLFLEVPMDKKEDKEPNGIETVTQVAENGFSNEQESLKDTEELTDLDISGKLQEVLAQVNIMEDNSSTVSDEEIDSLLMAAQRELLAKRVFKENGKVDAMALLNEVELELYDDQRNPLFIRLKEGFFKLRTAVADRND